MQYPARGLRPIITYEQQRHFVIIILGIVTKSSNSLNYNNDIPWN